MQTSSTAILLGHRFESYSRLQYGSLKSNINYAFLLNSIQCFLVLLFLLQIFHNMNVLYIMKNNIFESRNLNCITKKDYRIPELKNYSMTNQNCEHVEQVKWKLWFEFKLSFFISWKTKKYESKQVYLKMLKTEKIHISGLRLPIWLWIVSKFL